MDCPTKKKKKPNHLSYILWTGQRIKNSPFVWGNYFARFILFFRWKKLFGMVWKNNVRIIWFCEFWNGINDWDFRYYIRIWKVKKIGMK